METFEILTFRAVNFTSKATHQRFFCVTSHSYHVFVMFQAWAAPTWRPVPGTAASPKACHVQTMSSRTGNCSGWIFAALPTATIRKKYTHVRSLRV